MGGNNVVNLDLWEHVPPIPFDTLPIHIQKEMIEQYKFHNFNEYHEYWYQKVLCTDDFEAEKE